MSETHRPRRILRHIGAVLAGLLAILVALYIVLYVAVQMALNRTDTDAKQRSVTSKDGTIIAYEQTGAEPAHTMPYDLAIMAGTQTRKPFAGQAMVCGYRTDSGSGRQRE